MMDLIAEVKAYWKECGGDLSATYEKFSNNFSPSDIYNIILGKYNDSSTEDCTYEKNSTVIRRSIIIGEQEKPKEDVNGNRLNPFIYQKDDEDKKTIVGVKPDWKAVKVEKLVPVERKTMEIEIGEPKPVRPAPPAPETLPLNYESIGFAIGFKKAGAKEVLELANGNTARLIPALQWLYKQTSEEGLRKRIQEITLDVLFN